MLIKKDFVVEQHEEKHDDVVRINLVDLDEDFINLTELYRQNKLLDEYLFVTKLMKQFDQLGILMD